MANRKTALKRAKKEARKREQMLSQGPFIPPTEVPEFKEVEYIDLPPTGSDDYPK